MTQPKVSVIIPAYNQANYLGAAIESVLAQTYQNFELIIVNDASPDHTDQVVKSFSDPRINYIIHPKNKHLAASRNTGIRASTGEIIMLLDADDLFHPEKLALHVEFLKNNPDIDVTYNGRFELNYSAETIRELVRPPQQVTLSDLVLGFPFSPSDMVVRREKIFGVGLFDESYVHFSEDLDINCRLALAGYRFASVDRVLNYRRHHSGRIVRNISERLAAALRSLNATFSDSRCPDEVLALRDIAFMNNYLVWAYAAYFQNETKLGQEYTRKAIQLSPSIIEGSPSKFVKFLATSSITDENLNHETILQQVFAQLPSELSHLSEQYNWAVVRGHLIKETRAVIWDRASDNNSLLATGAEKLRAHIDDEYLRELVHQILAYEIEFGNEAANSILEKLSSYLKKIGCRRCARKLKGLYAITQAFHSYQSGQYNRVSRQVIQAIKNDVTYVSNRGAMVILFRSLVNPSN